MYVRVVSHEYSGVRLIAIALLESSLRSPSEHNATCYYPNTTVLPLVWMFGVITNRVSIPNVYTILEYMIPGAR